MTSPHSTLERAFYLTGYTDKMLREVEIRQDQS